MIYLLPCLLAALPGALLVSAEPHVSLDIFGPSFVDVVDELLVTLNVTNTGTESLKLIELPFSPLSPIYVDLFTIENEWGLRPQFVGKQVEDDLDLIVSEDDETRATAYTTLHPGQSVQAIYGVASVYEFSASGPGIYTLKIKAPVTLYHASKGHILAFSPDLSSEPLVVKISGTTVTRAQMHDDDSTPCDQWEMQELRRSIIVAKNYTSTALMTLQEGGYAGALYQRWFGSPNHTRFDIVLDHFLRVSQNRYEDYSYDCFSVGCEGEDKMLAYVLGGADDEFGNVHLCPRYFHPSTKRCGDKSRASTIVHEATHFKANGGTKDVPYGYRKADALKLAAENPDGAVENASNYEYFAVEASGGACPVEWLAGEGDGDWLPAQQAVMSPRVHAGEGVVVV